MLDVGSAILDADAPKGARHLVAPEVKGSSGTGRMLINLSQARGEGRIDHVVNCDVYGEGTQWTKAMIGWFVSLDIENVKEKRSWFQVMDVIDAQHLKLQRWSCWRGDINLGYSRFIYNPAKGQKLPSLAAQGYTYGGPEPDNARQTLYSNPLAIGVLPKALEKAASEGKYLIAPGTYFADPWNAGGLHVEAVDQDWKKGDKLELACGTGQSMCDWTGFHFGELGANDHIMGLCISAYIENRPPNGFGVDIQNMGVGVHVALPAEKQGNGVIVVGEPVDGAFIAAPDVPALRCYHSDIPFVQGSKERSAMEIVAPSGEVPLSVNKNGVTVNGTLTGNPRTRGKAVFSGDGSTKTFTVKFPAAYRVEPCIAVSSDQFARSRVAAVTRESLAVEFESAPPAGKDNVAIWWMAQE